MWLWKVDIQKISRKLFLQNFLQMKMIFYADDDIDDVEIFQEAVSRVVTDVEVIPTSNCEDLLANIENNKFPLPDYIFLDLNMPKKSGRICLKDLRQNPLLKDTRVIILSTSRNEHDILSTYEDGADYYISKPNSLGGYKEALSKLFSAPFDSRPPIDRYLIN